jgi:hypothetical protein
MLSNLQNSHPIHHDVNLYHLLYDEGRGRSSENELTRYSPRQLEREGHVKQEAEKQRMVHEYHSTVAKQQHQQ